MTRTVPSGVSAAYSTVVDLLKIYYWDGDSEESVSLTNAAHDIDADVGSGAETFVGSGLALSVASVTENTDFAGMGVDVSLDGVDQTIIAIVLANNMRGRPIKIWKAWLDDDTGAIIGSPLLVFDGVQKEPYSITSSQAGDQPGLVTVSTRAVTKLTKVNYIRSVMSNITSHNDMLKRSGDSTGDTFFQNVPKLNERTIQWGQSATNLGYSGGTGGWGWNWPGSGSIPWG